MINKSLLSCLLLGLAFCLSLAGKIQAQTPDYFPGEIYMKVNNDFAINLDLFADDSVDIAQQLPFLQSFVNAFGVYSVRRSFYFSSDPGLARTFRIYFSKVNLTDGFLSELEAQPAVEYAEQVSALTTDFTPNDLKANALGTVNGQWNLYKISAEQAWDLHFGDPNVVVAVVDNAIAINHTDLQGVLVQGYDVADLDTDPSPFSGSFSHGSHVSGIVGANTNNNIGIASIGFGISIMPVKATKNTGPSYAIHKGYEGITWAATNGADIINCSWGGTGGGITGQNVINSAWNMGSIIVAAAGNSNTNTLFYPAAYQNVIAVASTDIGDIRSSFSNFGTYIDLCAPGSDIYSLLPYSQYGNFSGTSMASPHVAGLLGLMKSANPNLSNLQLINCLTTTCDNIDAQNPTFIGSLGSGRINAFKALQCVSFTPCPPDYVFVSPTNDMNAVAQYYEAQQFIEASNKVTGASSITYDAGDYVLLKDGFYAGVSGTGSKFWALIDGCNGPIVGVDDGPENPEDPYNIRLSPNPATESVVIQMGIASERSLNILCYDLSGKCLLHHTVAPGTLSCTLDVSAFQPGIYFIAIQADQTIVKKFVKQAP